MQKLSALPKKVSVALSGGVDSVVLLHYLKRNHDVTALHYVHDSEYALTELEFVTNMCKEWNVRLVVEYQTKPKSKDQSKEEGWREARYKFFKNVDETVCTGHTLNDAAEWYVFSSLNGAGHYMEYRHANVVRPFITTRKEELLAYAKKHELTWLEDPSNQDTNFAARNRIRHEILPLALKVNPGIFSMVRKRIIQKHTIALARIASH
jgi:tRNA(Ile)-lysidine synthase